MSCDDASVFNQLLFRKGAAFKHARVDTGPKDLQAVSQKATNTQLGAPRSLHPRVNRPENSDKPSIRQA